MKPQRFLLTLLSTLCLFAAAAQGQTIKSLGYNTTNGRVVAATNVVWTNAFTFSTNTVAAQVRTNLGATTIGHSVFTATNVTAARNALELNMGTGTPISLYMSNVSVLNYLMLPDSSAATINSIWISSSKLRYQHGITTNTERIVLDNVDNLATLNSPAAARTNLGLGLPALTNTSNETAMRALSGSTNTNHPFSGTVSVVGTNNTNTLTFSNGILQSVQ